MKINSYRDLVVWQKGIELVVEIYTLTKYFPKEETFGLSSQIKRSAVSIPSNIAEGRGRGTRKDFVQFLRIAYGSGSELETQLVITQRLGLVTKKELEKADALLGEVMRMLNVMIKKLSANPDKL